MSSNIIKHVTRTIYGGYLQTARVLNRPIDIKEHTTINEAINDEIKVPFQPSVKTFGMQECETYDSNRDSNQVKISYVVIGNGGHMVNIGNSGGVSYTSLNIHQSTDSAPFRLLPFVCRPINMDLPDSERANYRLRKTLLIDGSLYVAYYAKVIDFTNSEIEMTTARTENGETTYAPFEPSINNLRAQPVTPGLENDGTKTFATAKASFEMTEKDMNYFTEACINLYGSSNEAIISEIAFCSGVDKPIRRQFPNSGTQTTTSVNASRGLIETVGMQVCAFVNTYWQANLGMSGFTITFDIGAIEPLFGKTRA